MPTFSPQRLKEARKQAGLTQAELARSLQVTERNIGRWERGQNTPRAETIGRLAEVLSVPIEELFPQKAAA